MIVIVFFIYFLSNQWFVNTMDIIHYIRNIFRKTNISYPQIRTRTYAYQGVRNISFSENFAYVLNEWSSDELS